MSDILLTAISIIEAMAATELIANDPYSDLECLYCNLACHRDYIMRPSPLDHDRECPIRRAYLWLQELPENRIVQGGTCWACGAWGKDMQWWNVGLYGDDGNMHLNKRLSYLIHKEPACIRKAEQKVMKQKEPQEKGT